VKVYLQFNDLKCRLAYDLKGRNHLLDLFDRNPQLTTIGVSKSLTGRVYATYRREGKDIVWYDKTLTLVEVCQPLVNGLDTLLPTRPGKEVLLSEDDQWDTEIQATLKLVAVRGATRAHKPTSEPAKKANGENGWLHSGLEQGESK